MYKHLVTGVSALLITACSSAPTPPEINGNNVLINPEPIHTPSDTSQEVAMLTLVNAQLSITNSKLDALSIPPPPPAPIQEQSERFVIHYPFNGTHTPLEKVIPVLLAAEKACRVEIHGRTDGTEPTLIEKRVAKERAASVRDQLVKYGTEADMIYISYLPSTDYVGRNWTAEGRAQNRRVEIDVFDVCLPDVEQK
ncbi:OmpA family protein [Vibrio scophthalmi]|uniref:Outer membrane protein n=1 Tax=Vibrio scophthalmi LMG 19158 TaxID=870967 RepID=F9RQN9_9VIBR|nr:OmpA family protein [Vibrio scophthalmi]EGU33970.1 outer membrane protein [Vibrio scophthalmi LMG 19158]